MLTTEQKWQAGVDDRQEKLRKLTELSRSLTYATHVDEVMQLAVYRAADLLEADKAVLLLADEKGELFVRAAHGISAERVERFRGPLEETLSNRLSALLEPAAEGSVIAVPLVVRGRVTGVLAVSLPGGRKSSEADEWLLSALADQAAVALEQARLDVEVSSVSERLRALEQSLAQKDQAVAMLAHDLRGPVATLELSLALLERSSLSDAQSAALGRAR